MADDFDVENNCSENILYDLSVLAEWKLDNELFTRSSKEKLNTSVIGRVSSLARRSAWTFLRSVGIPMQMPTPCLLPEQLVRLKSSQNSWRIAVSSTGIWVAIAQESGIEIRSLRDGLESVCGRYTFSHDSYPQWRCVAWSEDESMVACSRSNGAVDVLDILGTLLFTIPGVPDDGLTPPDLSNAVSAIIFTDLKPEDEQWSYELLIINYHGTLSSYLVNRDNGFKLRYTFVFAVQYPKGISSACYSSQNKMLLVGGAGLVDSSLSSSKARQEGITAWRLMSDAPYCKLITDYEEDMHKAKLKVSMLSKLKVSSVVQWNNVQVDGIFNLCLSPCGKMLVAIHFSGKLSMWDVPSLHPRKEFVLEDQPCWDEINPDLLENPIKRKRVKDLIPHKQLLDVNFWSEDHLILARCTGAVSVVSPEDLHNLLGKSPEWYEPSPQVTQAHNGGFLGLECEVRFPKKRIHMMNSENEEDEGDDSDEEDASLMARANEISKQVLFYLTDNERFQPPKKKPKFVTKVYRVVQLKSTTPEDLYSRKIEAEEYGEALVLAQAYKLDSDLVYQRQWRKSEVSLASIQDYLNKISKRAWILHECLERVPDNIDAMRELLQYGLSGTDLPALIAIGKGEDGGRFILCDPEEGLYEDIYDEFNPESQRQKEEKRAHIKQALLDQVDFTNLNLEQKELCRARLKFLQYMDRLKTYECILGGPNAAAERYNAVFFTSFRSRNIFELAAEYAQNSDWRALETLMTFHSSDLGSHRLAILSNFSETTDPSEYKSLLPEISEDGEVLPWETDSWRDPDWSELPACRRAVDLGSEDEAHFFYTDFDSKYRKEKLSRDLVQEWYFTRVFEIEKKARLVDNAIELVKLAMERGAENLSELLDDLMVMDMMVYECGVEDSLTFSALREMADYDRLEYIMSKSTEEMYSKNLRRWMIPFLKRCEQKEPMAYNRLLRDYVLTKARSDLTLVLKIFEASKPTAPSPVIQTQAELMSLVLDSLYSCERSDQLDLAIKIYECLPIWSHDPSKESPEITRLHKQVDHLEQHISAAKIFLAYGINKTLVSIKESENNPDDAKRLMIKLTRLAGKRNIPLSEIEWHKLHEDVLFLQNKVYHCISPSVCHEIFVESLMCSERQETIHLAGQMLERSVESKPSHLSKGAGKFKVPYAKAVELVLSAAKEYFDSSANLSDPCMDLARSCLNLILDAPQPIQEELDLIASLALLDEFGVAVLPLQVRLSKNRLDLVKKAVTTKPTSYKQTQRLLRLGQLLAIPCKNNDEREGVILQMSAEAAVAALDYEFAYQCCERLISLCHSPAWSVCVKLAEQEGFQNILAKSKLLSFALTYCSKDMIQPVLRARCLLETQILYEQINKILNEDKESNSPASRESPFSARAAIKQSQQILSSTKKTTSAVLSTVTDTKWWQSAITSLKHPQHDRGDKDTGRGKGNKNTSFTKQGCHPFYSGFIEDCYEDLTAADYWGVADSHADSDSILSAHLLRAAKLEDMLTQGEKQHLAVEALMDLAKKTMARDTTLGLAYLLAIPQGHNIDSCFESFPSTDISLQVAVYFYSLQIYSTMQPFTPPHVYALYRQTPTKVIGRVLDYLASSSEVEWSEDVRALVKKLQMYQEMFEDYSQACTLKRLGKGVDVIRFAEDNEYKRETILGLAMSLDDEVYNISLSLAKRYDLPLWDVYMCHLEYLFYDSGLSIEDLQIRVSKLDILSTLNERSSEFTERMMTRIYPTLAGTDLRTLTYFFSLLEAVQNKVLCGLSPSEHASLLRKLKPTCPGLDYKKLMDKDTSSLDVLCPCLTASNINTLAKLAPHIPEKEGSFLQPSALYSCWASQVFWGRDGSKKSPENMTGWVHRYEAIGEWIQKLRPEDLLVLIDSIIFTPEAREKLDVSCRVEISKRALKFSRQSGTGKKKKQDDSGKLSWEECSIHLQTRLSHLTSLTNDTIQSFAQATDLTFSSYAQKYDLSKGDLQVVELLLVQMILDGQAVELVDDILQVAPPSSLRTRTIVRRAVSLIVKALRGEEFVQGIKASKSWLEVLQMVVENVRKHQDNGGDLVEAEDVMSLLRSFCSDASIEVPPRLNVLKVLEKSFDLSDTDRVLLTLYRTGALVSSTWPEIEVTEQNIIIEESRLDLFLRLLDKCVTNDHFLTLCRILILWPPFSLTYSSDTDKNPWIKVFTAVLTSQGKHGGEIISKVLKNECSEFPLSDKCTEHIFEVLLRHHQPVCAVKLILQSSHGKLLDKGLSVLASLTEGTDDEDLLKLILRNKLSPQVVSMPVYLHLVMYILNCQGQPDCPGYASPFDVASQLYEAGAEAEAGSLLLQARSSHSLLQTFNSALTSLSHLFKKS